MAYAYPPPLRTRAEAIAIGAKAYYNGVPCPSGHLDYRRITGACAECVRIRCKAKREANPERHKKWCRDNYWRTKEQRKIARRAWDELRPDYYREKARRWKAENRARATANQNARYAKQKSLRCACCTNEQFFAIYEEARAIGGHVDHIIPMALGGPHCLKNLQVLTVKQHIEKTKHDRQKISDARRAA